MKRYLTALWLALIFGVQVLLSAPHGSAVIETADTQIVSGQQTTLRIELRIDDGWHIYGQNPGEIGLPTTIKWHLPEGVTIDNERWPEETPFSYSGIDGLGYSGNISIFATLSVSDSYRSETIPISADVSWLACNDGCFPETVTSNHQLTIGSHRIPNAAFSTQLSSSLSTDAPIHSLGSMLLFALLGGLILNIMPCVFPVLALKVMSFSSLSGGKKSKIILHALSFSLGVVLTFLTLALLVLMLRFFGAQVGWGFQLQSPWVVGALAVLMSIMGIYFLGIFSSDFGSHRFAQFLPKSDGLLGSFLNGVLATILATPCTAPFMGAAIGFAFVSPMYVVLLIFFFLGLGMALPYVFLALFPSLIRYLPKPGQWMITVKKLCSIPMFLTAAWLIWIFVQQVSVPTNTIDSTPWKETVVFSSEELRRYQDEGRMVFVDVTASWCLTCLVNKESTLTHPDVVAALNDAGVIVMIADWTNRDDRITTFLEEYGRSGIPFYLLTGPNGETRILPEVLTPRIVIDAIRDLESQT